MRGGGGGHRVGTRRQQHGEQRRRRHGSDRPVRQVPQPDQQQRRAETDHGDQPAQPRQVVRSTRQQEHVERRGHRDRAGQRHGGGVRRAAPPQQHGADADERGHRGREGHGVVGVEDPCHVTERQRGHGQPSTPHQQGRAHAVGARCPPGDPQAGAQQQQRGREQPGDLPAHLRGQHPQQPGLAPAASAATTDRAGLVAREPAEPVVAEGQLEHRVRLGAADVGTVARGPQLHERHPPTGAQQQRGEPGEQVADPLAERHRSGEQVDQHEGGQDQERLEHLRQEGQPEEGAAEREPAHRMVGQPGGARPRGLQGAQRARRGRDQQQDQQGVGVVEAEHQHRDRGEREHGPGEQPGAGRPRRTTDRAVQQPDGCHAHQRLRHQEAPRRQAEDPDGEVHHPQRGGGLVDRDRVRRVEGAEQERLPRHGACLRGGGIEGVRPSGCAQAPQVEHAGCGEEREESRPRPRGIGSGGGTAGGPRGTRRGRGRLPRCLCRGSLCRGGLGRGLGAHADNLGAGAGVPVCPICHGAVSPEAPAGRSAGEADGEGGVPGAGGDRDRAPVGGGDRVHE